MTPSSLAADLIILTGLGWVEPALRGFNYGRRDKASSISLLISGGRLADETAYAICAASSKDCTIVRDDEPQ